MNQLFVTMAHYSPFWYHFIYKQYDCKLFKTLGSPVDRDLSTPMSWCIVDSKDERESILSTPFSVSSQSLDELSKKCLCDGIADSIELIREECKKCEGGDDIDVESVYTHESEESRPNSPPIIVDDIVYDDENE